MLVAAGLAFGAGMAISGSCVSAHLYRLGEGSPTAPFALIGTATGFALGFLTWNALYISRRRRPRRSSGCRRTLGYAGALVLGLAVLAIARRRIAALEKSAPARSAEQRQRAACRSSSRAGRPGSAGSRSARLGTVAYLRVAPLGVTAELGARSRQAADCARDSAARGSKASTRCAAASIAVSDALLTPNGLFVIALVLASFAAALVAGQFKPAPIRSLAQVVRGLAGGVLLGWGAMTGLGCTVGTLLSGIMAGALSGWVFGAAVFIGIAVTLRGMRWASP